MNPSPDRHVHPALSRFLFFREPSSEFYPEIQHRPEIERFGQSAPADATPIIKKFQLIQ
jgi:hypothetical protein